jgi:ketosteroid isomerase-like protein
MTNLELVQTFFAGAPDDLVAAIEDPEWVEVVRQVVVEAKLSGTTRRGGVHLEQDVAAVYTFESGRIRRIEEFSDPADAFAAARR